MFRWWKDKKKPTKDRKNRNVEDDYGFRKRAIIVQETISGHTVIIKDDLNHPNVLKFGATCRARMPTPVQNFNETSSHIYDEIPELPVQTRFSSQNQNEADIVKDTRAREKVDLRNAIEVGPYLIVPVVGPACSTQDVEIFKRNVCPKCSNMENTNSICNCDQNNSETKQEPHLNSPLNEQLPSPNGASSETRIVLTRCVKSKPSLHDLDSLDPTCSSTNQEPDMCSFETFLKADDGSRTLTDSPDTESNSRTLTGTPVSNSRTPVFFLDKDEEDVEKCDTANAPDEILNSNHVNVDTAPVGNDACWEYDMSTSGESSTSENSDYDLYLSKIEGNLKLKHNVRKIIKSLEQTIEEETDDTCSDYHDCAFQFRQCSQEKCDRDSITYVSSLSEYSSAASHNSDISADRSASDDSSGYYECADDNTASRDLKRDSRVNLERSVSAPDGSSSCSNDIVKKSRHKHSRSKKSQHRSNSFDCSIYTPLSDEQNQELYHFPTNNKGDSDSSSSSSGIHKHKSKPMLTPQATPAYMDPYRGRSRSHNRLLGDLIRMNYNKQTFIQR